MSDSLIKVGMISLGCPKNQVDAEMMLARLADAGYEITNSAEGADIVIVNTCGFIEDAKREAIDNILDMISLKQEGRLRAIVITGCLAERYREEVAREFPEADAVVGIGCNGDIVEVCNNVHSGEAFCRFSEKRNMPLDGDRLLTTPKHWAYLKIADGCSNCCSYCAIPKIRGPFRSRSLESILDEAKALSQSGVKEVVLIAQDTTRYGEDIYGENKLVCLLNELCKLPFRWIRLYYCYPDRLTDELISTIKNQDKIVNYIDIPLQHASGRVLKAMNRSGDRESLTALLKKIRAEIPDIVFRTTFITGFPGETQEDFSQLCEFVYDIGFDKMGCFPYSPEEGTPAAAMDNQVEERVKQRRAEVLMNEQYGIASQKNREYIGKVFNVIVDGFDDESCLYYGRSYMDAPEIDTGIYFGSLSEHTPGEFVNVIIKDVYEYDLIGEEV